MASKLHPLEAALRKIALSYPETREEFPWGERLDTRFFSPLALALGVGAALVAWGG